MYTFKDLVEITAKLRAEDGCPWDREQTFESLRKYIRIILVMFQQCHWQTWQEWLLYLFFLLL